KEAVGVSQRAVDTATQMVTRAPGDPARLHALAVAEADSCVTLSQASESSAAIAMCRKSVTTQESVVVAMPNDQTQRRALNVMRNRTINAITDAYSQTKGDPSLLQEAVALGGKAVAFGVDRVGAVPNDDLAKRDLFADYNNLGDALYLS